MVSKVHPGEIYNLAAQSHVQVSFDAPEFTADVDATGVQHSVREFCCLAFKQVGIDLEFVGEGADGKGVDKATGRVLVEVSKDFYRPTDVVNLWGAPTKAKTQLGWDPMKTSFEQLVKIMVDADMTKVAVERTVEEIFARCPSISIDCGVLEQADNVFVRSSDFGWNDVGTWGSLCELSGKDADGNVVARNSGAERTGSVSKTDLIVSVSNKFCNLHGQNPLATLPMKTYTPTPLDTREIQLPESLDELTEQLARNVHEVWAQGRIAEGWRYGERRDDQLKTHPCLVPYEQLPESEREYDRQTALQTLKLILRLGFRIQR